MEKRMIRHPAEEEARTRAALLHILEDLQRERNAFREARQQWMRTVDAFSSPLVVHDADGRVTRANRAYAERAGMEFAEMIGRPYWKCFPRRADAIPAGETSVSVQSGETFDVRRFDVPDGALGSVLTLCVFEDVTERRRHEAMAAAVAAIGDSPAIETGDVEALARKVTEEATRLTGVARANVWLFDEHETELSCIDLFEAHSGRHSQGAVLRQAEFASEFAALKQARFVDASDARTDARTAGYLESYLEPLGITSMLDASIAYSGRHVGVLCLEHVRDLHRWRIDEVQFACQLADKLALAVANRARRAAERQLHRLNRALRTLSAGNTALVRATDESALYGEMTRILTELGGYAVAFVGLARDDAERSVEPAAAAGVDIELLRGRLSWAEGIETMVGRAIRLDATQLERFAGASAAYALWHDYFEKNGIRSVLALPLRVGRSAHPLGALCIAASDSEAFDADEVKLMEELAGDLAFGIAHLRGEAERAEAREKLRRSLEGTIAAVVATMESRDPYTAGHERRVADLAAAIAREMGVPEETVEGIQFGALIHDLGKIQVPAEILVKPTRLTKIEFELIKQHPQAGHDIVRSIDFPWPVARMVLEHHERLDGSGYPQGLKGEEIALEARILAVADVVEAMASHRPYRPGRGIDAALDEIQEKRGTWFEPAAVDACLRLFRDKGFTLQAG